MVQDLFLRIWEHRELWDPAGALNAYLFRAVRNRAFNYLRHQRVKTKFCERTADELSPRSTNISSLMPDQVLRLHEIEDAVERAVQALPPRCREVFQLNRYQRLSYVQVAHVLQISVKTVEMQMGRALASLRRSLADWRE